MDRLTSKQLKDLLDFLRGSYACHDQEAFVTHLLQGIATVVRSDASTYTEIDPRSGRILDASRIEPSDIEFPGNRQIFAQHISEYPILTYYQRTRDGSAVKISDFLTQSQFHRLGLYQEFFRRVKVEDQMTVSLAVRPTRLIVLALGIQRGRRTFTERDRLLLNLLRPHLAQAYANAQAVSAMQQEVCLSRQALETNGQGVVVLTKDGQVRLMTPRARDWLAMYFGPIKAEGLPEALQAWLSHQEAVLGRADDAPRPREPLRVECDGTCLLVRHLCETDHCLLLLEERQTAPEPATFERDGLTRREVEVLHWVTQGKTNAEIGCILGMSTRTVQKHLEHIFEKLGVETRMAAAALAQGWRFGA